jgi:rhodanese-related sulfurtransferase
MTSDFGEPTTVDALLARARDQLDRVTPEGACHLADNGAVLIDIRSDGQRQADGAVPGAIVIPRNVLEWRLDPQSPDRDRALAQRGRRVILVCHEGYQSSLAAATVRRFGLDATDVIGGARAWKAAGLPLESP